MVVDIRYHLASIVAVFLALGLGILVGTSLSDGEGLEQQEKWLASLEHELESLRKSGERTAALLDQTGAERDRYMHFAAELSQFVMGGLLEGERAAVVLLGGVSPHQDAVEEILRRSGALVVRRAVVGPGWPAAEADRTAAAGHAAPEAGEALASALTESEAPLGEAPAGGAAGLALEAPSPQPPTVAVLLLAGRPDRYGQLARELASALERRGVRVAAVVPSDSEWMSALGDLMLPYVAHVDTPMGALSLALLLKTGAAGGYGIGEGRALWPADALR